MSDHHAPRVSGSVGGVYGRNAAMASVSRRTRLYSARTPCCLRCAVLITSAQGEILGAAGGSGGTGEEDEACCAYGIEQAGLRPDASA